MNITSDKSTTLSGNLMEGHEYEVTVVAIGPDGTRQPMDEAARNTIIIRGRQTSPDIPSTLTAAGYLEAISLAWVNPANYDMRYIEIWRSADAQYDNATKIGISTGTTYTDIIGTAGATYYYWINAVNTSGVAGDSYPAQSLAGVSATTLGIDVTDIDDFAIAATKMFTKAIVLTADVWTNNSPIAGSVAWNAHSIVYNGATYPITAGNSALAYIYWTIGAATYTGSASHPALGTTAFMIAINTAGIHTLVWNSSANMVIGTAFIMDLAVEKVLAGTITSKTITLATAASVDCYINAGKTAWDNTQTGFILGIDDVTPKFYIGNTTNYLNWTGTALNIAGVITVTAGSNVEAGADVTSTHTAADIINLPATPAGAGLYCSGTYLGYYSGAAWKAYIKNDGDFYFGGDASNYLQWNGSTLTVRGAITADDITAGTLTGRTVQTAAAVGGHGKRIVLSQADNTLRLHTATTENVIIIDDNIIDADHPGIAIYHTDGRIYVEDDADRYTDISPGNISCIGDTSGMRFFGGQTVSITDAEQGVYNAQIGPSLTGKFFVGKLGLNVTFAVDQAGNITTVGTVDGVDVSDHSARHENGGADEISVAGLSGVLADAQPTSGYSGTRVIIESGSVLMDYEISGGRIISITSHA